MTHPVIGWELATPVPNGYQFTNYLQARHGRLLLDGLDLTQFFYNDAQNQALGRALPSPLEIVYLPLIGHQIQAMKDMFAAIIDELEYGGRFLYAYASKANAAEEVVRSTLAAGAHHEMSSTVDVDIARLMKRRGLLPADRYLICNGFKAPGTEYARNIERLRADHELIIPVLENLEELGPWLESSHAYQIGLRQKSYGHHTSLAEMEAAHSRFGMHRADIFKAASYIDAATNLTLTLYHAMVGSQILDEAAFVEYLRPSIEIYAQLRQMYPELHIFDFGGGMPVRMTLDFDFDHRAFIRGLLTALRDTCRQYDVPEPDVMGEFGRYTTSEHGAHLFRIITVKENRSRLPWYIIDGSIMSSFPDSWALGEHFIVLPLNHLDQPFQQVQLGGITCDSDDIFPPKLSQSPLYLPVNTEDLYVGFFSIGAYQEMLGGVRGSKHCVLPEAFELVVDRQDGRLTFEVLKGQSPADVLINLGYHDASN